MDIKKILSEMTLEEKLAELTQLNANMLGIDAGAAITGPAKAMRLTEAALNSAGSTLNFIGAKVMKEIQKLHLERNPHNIPLLFMQDVIHGYRTIYPIPLAMAATFDPDIYEECCAMAARESAAAGVHVTFGPMVDLVRDARWGRVMESAGEDPYLGSIMARAQVRGFQRGNKDDRQNVSACVKHFAAYGAAEAGRDYNTVDMSDHTLREYYLPAYRAAIDEGVDMVMTSFNLYNGVPAAGNKYLVKHILRDEWGFDKVIISDYSSFSQMKKHGYLETDKECARESLLTTTDIEMMSSEYLTYAKELIEEGSIKIEDIDASVMRVLELKEKLGLFENPYRSASEEDEEKLFLSKEHRDICRRAAEKSAVLLKNDGVLPFSADIKSIAVIGPLAKRGMIGFWSCAGREDEAVSVYQGIASLIGEEKIVYAEGCSSKLRAKPDRDMISEAVKAAKSAEAVVLCLGEEREMSGEGNSRVDISLPEAQVALIRAVAEANPKTAVLLYTGRPLALTDIVDDAPAIFTVWQPGSEGGSAAANLIFGKASFEGRLPMSFPYHSGQCPIYYNRMNTGRPRPKEFEPTPYTSCYLDYPNRPLFKFGYGLTYTEFEMTPVKLSADTMKAGEKITATVTVKNIGEREGVAMPELYIRDVYASVTRPVQELRGYKKISLLPGESSEVSFDITEDMLRFHTADGSYASEAGLFHVFVEDSAEVGTPVSFRLI
ncbi:MAG: glycoside hydrolase family 3 C-terminal domain-containing protein [Clostridia bacterium]|nr:glycoside hydrolase family 3 C-terminal domain-containing protein [Clostridia bacterium]